MLSGLTHCNCSEVEIHPLYHKIVLKLQNLQSDKLTTISRPQEAVRSKSIEKIWHLTSDSAASEGSRGTLPIIPWWWNDRGRNNSFAVFIAEYYSTIWRQPHDDLLLTVIGLTLIEGIILATVRQHQSQWKLDWLFWRGSRWLRIILHFSQFKVCSSLSSK